MVPGGAGGYPRHLHKAERGTGQRKPTIRSANGERDSNAKPESIDKTFQEGKSKKLILVLLKNGIKRAQVGCVHPVI